MIEAAVIDEPAVMSPGGPQIARLIATGHYDGMAQRYLEGGCLAFAYALWIAHGLPADGSIAILSNDLGEGWGEIDHEATHAYLDLPTAEIDVRGVRPVADMAEDLYVEEYSIAAVLRPDDAIATYAGGFSEDVDQGDYPIELRKDDILDALVHIANNPERYGLRE
jgi:hypothetical protein